MSAEQNESKILNGLIGESGFLTTTVDSFVAKARSNSLVSFSLANSCCGSEMLNVYEGKYDLMRHGVISALAPAESDLLLVGGVITRKSAPYLVSVFEQMLKPKYVVALGACACSGGAFQSYSTLRGVGEVLPVDVFVPGCPPAPEAIVDAVMLIKKMVVSRQKRPWVDAFERDSL